MVTDIESLRRLGLKPGLTILGMAPFGTRLAITKTRVKLACARSPRYHWVEVNVFCAMANVPVRKTQGV